jgi:hypothetical protein
MTNFLVTGGWATPSATIYVIDPNSGATLGQLPAPYLWPGGIAWDGTNIWVTDYSTSAPAGPKLFQLNGQTGAILGFWPVPYSYWWAGATWDGSHVWFGANCNPSILVPCKIYKFDVVSHTCVDSITIPTSYINGLTWMNGHFIYSDHIRNKLFMMSATGVLEDSSVYAGPQPSGTCLQGNLLCVIDRTNHNIYKYNAPTPPQQLNLSVTMTPISPPIQIPAGGGSFNFNATVQNNGPNQAPFYAWARNRNPNGSYTVILLGPVNINPPVGVTVTRTRTQVVPSTWAAGNHYMIGYANTASGSYPAIDADSFMWTKLTTYDGGPMVWEAANYGESFAPYEVTGEDVCPTSFALIEASPNPFNPSTDIRYQMTDGRHVSLKVFDTAGRLVATLVDGWREAGSHQVSFDGSNLASGVYLYSLTAGTNHATGKMVLMK